MKYTKKHEFPFFEDTDKVELDSYTEELAAKLDDATSNQDKRIDKQLQNMTLNTPSEAEIVDARGDYELLGYRLNAWDLIVKQKVYHFQNIEAMKNCLTLIPGDVVQTLGYYEANDGGGALYRIVNDSTLTDDGGLVHDLKIGSKAKIIVNKNSVIAEQVGFKKNDSSFDNKAVMDRIMNSSNLNSKVLEIVFGNGIYRFTDTLLKSNIHIKAKLGVFAEEEVSTVFAPFSSGQRYVMKLGGTEDFDTPQNLSDYYSKNYSIDGVVFSDNLYNLKQDDTETEKYGLLCVEYGANVYLNVGFKNCFSRCIYLRNCWEIEFENLYLRAIYTNTEVSALYVDNVLSDGTSNTSRILFKNIDIELLNSQFIKTGNSPNMTNITIDVLSIENGRTSTALGENSGRMVSKFSNVDLELYKSCQIKSLFELNQCDGLSINILNIHNFASGYYHTGEKDTEGEYIKYVDGLFKFNGYYNVAVNQINLNHSGAYINLATGAGGYLGHAIFNCIEQGYYNNSTNSTGDAIIPAYLFYDVTVGSVEVVKTNCIVNYNELNVLHSGIYQNTELFKLSGRQMGKIRLEYDANSISKYVLKNFTESASTRFLDKIFVPFNCKLIARGKMGHNVKLDLILVKDDVQTTKSVDTSVNEVNKYKDYVYTLENEDYDYMYLKGQGPLFKLDYIEIQRI